VQSAELSDELEGLQVAEAYKRREKVHRHLEVAHLLDVKQPEEAAELGGLRGEDDGLMLRGGN